MPTERKKIILKSCDGVELEMDESVAMKTSLMIKNMVEDGSATPTITIPVPNVTGETLAMVIEYCTKHATVYDSDLLSYCCDFLEKDPTVLKDLMVAASYLEIDNLMGPLVDKVFGMPENMSWEDAKMAFGIDKDYSPEEEEELRKLFE